ncbi:MAG: DUF3997 domain-containing protein, partial [Clostridia bacterium]|nr:DUF3997 domain-containing protein [Clostridia bacterium]
CFGPGPADFSVDLPGGYQLIRLSAHNIKIEPKGGIKGEDYHEIPTIPTKVVELAFNDRYILAKRFSLKINPESSNGSRIPDESKELYYILDALDMVLYGPYDIKQFNEKRKELNINKDIKLKDVKSYR